MDNLAKNAGVVNFDQRGQDDRLKSDDGRQLWPGDTFSMQTFSGSCSPERLRTLQKIFDAVWLKVQTGAYRTTEALRDEIARRVAKHVNDVDPRPDEIAKAVLNSLTVNPPEDSRPPFLLFNLRPPRAA